MNLKITELSHTYEAKGLEPFIVLHPLETLCLAQGEQLLLRGISGSGKTTLLNIMAGLLKPTSGEVWLNGQPLYALSEAKRDRFRTQHIGYVFQTHHLLNMLTAVENVMMPLAFAGVGKDARQERAQQLLTELGLKEFLHYPPAKLSAGQRLRVAVARALANDPALVLADEPTAALDSSHSELVIDLLQETCSRNNAILLVASHDPALYGRFEHILDLHKGHITASYA